MHIILLGTQQRDRLSLLDRAEETASFACQILRKLLGQRVSRRIAESNRVDRDVPTIVKAVDFVKNLTCSVAWPPCCQEVYLR